MKVPQPPSVRAACALLLCAAAAFAAWGEGRTSSSAARRPSGAVPIVIVPGIAGSQLASKSGEILWPPLDEGSDTLGDIQELGDFLGLVASAVSRLNELELGSSAKIEAFSGPRIGSADAYAPLMRALERSRGEGEVFFFAYDWRKDNRDSAAALEAYVKKLCAQRGCAKVDIVAHSMGGLVVSAYLARPQAADRLRRLVLAGSPLAGSALAYASLVGAADGAAGTEGSELLLGLALPDAMRDLASRKGTSVNEIALGIEKTLRLMMRGYPSVYELLTSADCRRLAEAGLPDSRSSREAASKASGYRAAVGSRLGPIYAAAPRVELAVIAGTGRPTLASSPSAKSPSEARGASTYADGDGIVALESATAGSLFRSRATLFRTDHLGLVRDGDCLEFIASRLGR